MHVNDELILIANLAILAINIGVCGLTLKLYTEYFKDKAQDGRKQARNESTPESTR